MREKIEIGRRNQGDPIYLSGRGITFGGVWQDHKVILEKLGVYAEFSAHKSGPFSYIRIELPLMGTFIETVNKFRALEEPLGMKIYSHLKIKEKLGKLVAQNM